MTILPNHNELEARRIALQLKLDGGKISEARNELGQFATPPSLAREIVNYGIQLLPSDEKVRFLDPAIGSGAFYSSLCSIAPQERLESCTGYEIDPYYGEPACELWKGTPLRLHLSDFAKAVPDCRGANLVICNPPYVRHHHICASRKIELQERVMFTSGMKISGLAGLYCYFMGLSHAWMAKDGIAGWLVPSEFMGVNYGVEVKRYLMAKVTLLRIHRFDPQHVQFSDAVVSSAVVWIKNATPPANHKVAFTFGGTMDSTAKQRQMGLAEISCESKWTRFASDTKSIRRQQVSLGDLFEIKRGLVTGNNKYFILDKSKIEAMQLPMECFTPILPGPRHLRDNEVAADENGVPMIERQQYLLNTRLEEELLEKRFPALWKYLQRGRAGENPVSSSYLCSRRTPWYSQEHRPPAPLLCTYMGRKQNGRSPFRFILNWSKATASNVYLLLYPRPALEAVLSEDAEVARILWSLLNEINVDELLQHGRVYGGGLYKLEPRELRGFPADIISQHLDLPRLMLE